MPKKSASPASKPKKAPAKDKSPSSKEAAPKATLYEVEYLGTLHIYLGGCHWLKGTKRTVPKNVADACRDQVLLDKRGEPTSKKAFKIGEGKSYSLARKD